MRLFIRIIKEQEVNTMLELPIKKKWFNMIASR